MIIVKITIVNFVLFSFFSNFASAVLPPYFHRVKELKSVIEDKEVEKKIGQSKMIEGVIKTNSGYQIFTDECKLEVKINYIKSEPERLGPAEFEVKVGKLECKNEDKK